MFGLKNDSVVRDGIPEERAVELSVLKNCSDRSEHEKELSVFEDK